MSTIRLATLDDIDSLYAIGQNIPEFLVNTKTVTFWPKTIIKSAINSDDTFILVAEENIQLKGFIVATKNNGLKKAIIENMYVVPEFRQTGIGSELLKEMLQILLQQGCEYVATLVPIDAESAVQLYESAGFTIGETFIWLDKDLNDNLFSK